MIDQQAALRKATSAHIQAARGIRRKDFPGWRDGCDTFRACLARLRFVCCFTARLRLLNDRVPTGGGGFAGVLVGVLGGRGLLILVPSVPAV